MMLQKIAQNGKGGPAQIWQAWESHIRDTPTRDLAARSNILFGHRKSWPKVGFTQKRPTHVGIDHTAIGMTETRGRKRLQSPKMC
jgi:hypothetical protein